MNLISFITDFADQVVILPAIVIIALTLCLERRWQVASAWIFSSVLVLGTIGVLKSFLYACGWRLPNAPAQWLLLNSPSGHTASSALIAGGLVGLLSLKSGFRSLMPVYVGATVIASIIGITRILLGAHSVAEVLTGLAVGVSGSMLFALLAGPKLARPISLYAVATLMILAAAVHGIRLPAEEMIRTRWSNLIREVLVQCVPGSLTGDTDITNKRKLL